MRSSSSARRSAALAETANGSSPAAGDPLRSSREQSSATGDEIDAYRQATTDLRSILDARATTSNRAVETGSRGEGGDRTLVIDQAAEEVVFGELEKLHAAGRRFTAISEERGEVDYGGG